MTIRNRNYILAFEITYSNDRIKEKECRNICTFTKGQAVVLYDGDEVIGGGVIE